MPQDPLCLLCVEPRFPGRLGGVADRLVRRRGYRCWFYCHGADPKEFWPQATGRGLEIVPFGVGGVAREESVVWPRNLERGICFAYGCWEVLSARRPWPVDLVIGRSAGLGSTLFVPAALPGTPIINMFDYYYHPHGNDLAPEIGGRMPPEYFQWRRTANAMDLLDLENGITPWTTTRWQRDLFPDEYRADFKVVFDGIEERHAKRRPGRPRTIAGRAIPPEAKVVTFVAWQLDRLRGFDRFVELSNRLLRKRADVVCVAVGGGPVRRTLDVEFFGKDYGAHVLGQTPPHDPSRFWTLGKVAPAVVAEVFEASDLHVYPSRPYVVSRSLIEAMSAGALVLAWDSEPVREVLTPDKTAIVVPPEDLEGQERRALSALEDPAVHRPLCEAAQEIVRERYSREVSLPLLASMLDQLASKGH